MWSWREAFRKISRTSIGENGITEISRAEVAHRTDDEAFWSRAPQLSGDWPESWRRGLVYDLETLRMVMRSPVDFIPHVFDGNEIHGGTHDHAQRFKIVH